MLGFFLLNEPPTYCRTQKKLTNPGIDLRPVSNAINNKMNKMNIFKTIPVLHGISRSINNNPAFNSGH